MRLTRSAAETTQALSPNLSNLKTARKPAVFMDSTGAATDVQSVRDEQQQCEENVTPAVRSTRTRRSERLVGVFRDGSGKVSDADSELSDDNSSLSEEKHAALCGAKDWVQTEQVLEPSETMQFPLRLRSFPISIFDGEGDVKLLCLDHLLAASIALSKSTTTRAEKCRMRKELSEGKDFELRSKVIRVIKQGHAHGLDAAPAAVCLQLFEAKLGKTHSPLLREGRAAAVKFLRTLATEQVRYSVQNHECSLNQHG